MESPTTEISRGLEALRLAGQLEGLEKHPGSSASPQLPSVNQEKDERPSHLPPSSRVSTSHLSSTNRSQDSLPAASNESLSSCVCPCHSQLPQMHPCPQSSPPFAHLTCPCSVRRSPREVNPPANPTPSQATGRNLSKNIDSTSITESFSTLNVSSGPAGLAGLQTPILRSCREEAGAVPHMSCLDDTTVDDLAGYLDEIMFIPKPMSEMAELMYT